MNQKPRCPRGCDTPALHIEALSWCAVLDSGDLGSPQAPVTYDTMSRARCSGCGWYGNVEEYEQAQERSSSCSKCHRECSRTCMVMDRDRALICARCYLERAA